MLTREVRVAFTPQSTVTGIALSKDGRAFAWSEKLGLLNLSIDDLEPKQTSIEGNAQGIFFRDDKLYFGDDNFGIKCYDRTLELIWECEIPGGVSLVEMYHELIAVVDNLGRLVTVDYAGKIIDDNLQFSSIIKVLSVDSGLIIVQEDGTVHCFDGKNIIWSRPARGEVGEAITAVGTDLFGQLIIGREGYALVPGDEEALEIEVWNLVDNQIMMRDEVKSRLTNISSSTIGTYLGFDDGSIHMLESKAPSGYQLSDIIFHCKYPIQTLIASENSIIAGSWFYLHGITDDNRNWMVEHQGMVQFSAYSLANQAFYFAGDDQNDFTNIEPIGVIDISRELIEKDKSELTEWFELIGEVGTMSVDDIYSTDDKFESLLLNSESTSNSAGDNLNQILSALEEDNEPLSNPQDDILTDVILQDLAEELPTKNMPIANAGEDRIYDSGADESSIIVLDSNDTKGDKNRIVSYSWIDESGKEVSDLPKFRAKLNKGKYHFELRITDDEGNSTSDTIQIEVI